MTNVYQEVLTAGIANALNANPDNLQPVLQELPPDDAQIFSLLDLVPTDTDRTDFSTVFGTILTAQPPGALLTIAERNYENAANWINLGDRKVATYKPTRSDIVDTINRSQTIGYKSGSNSLKESTQISRPPSVDAHLNLLAEEIDWMNTQVQSLHLQLEHGTVAPIRPGPWFNPGIFTSAYKNKDWQPNPTSSSWEDVFGRQGDLQTIVTGVAVGSGLS